MCPLWAENCEVFKFAGYAPTRLGGRRTRRRGTVMIGDRRSAGGAKQIAGLQDREADLAGHPSFLHSPITLAKDDDGTSG